MVVQISNFENVQEFTNKLNIQVFVLHLFFSFFLEES